MAWELIDRIVAGDATAISQVLTSFGSSEPEVRKELLNRLAAEAPNSEACLDVLLRLIDDHGLDRSALRRILVDNDQADDAHQDVLIVVAQSVGNFNGDSAFTTWLHSVARNIAVDHLRKRKETVVFDAENHHGTAAGRLSSLIASRSDLAKAVNALPDTYREAVVLRDIEQRSYQEIADATDTEMNTVKSRISRGRALVAAMMSERLGEFGPPPNDPGTGSGSGGASPNDG